MIDRLGTTVSTDLDGLVRVDGAPVFRVHDVDGVIVLEFYDRDRRRSNQRRDGSCNPTVTMDALWSRVIGMIIDRRRAQVRGGVDTENLP